MKSYLDSGLSVQLLPKAVLLVLLRQQHLLHLVIKDDHKDHDHDDHDYDGDIMIIVIRTIMTIIIIQITIIWSPATSSPLGSTTETCLSLELASRASLEWRGQGGEGGGEGNDEDEDDEDEEDEDEDEADDHLAI